MNVLRVISPVDQRIYVERPFATAAQTEAVLELAVCAQSAWRRTPLAERARICRSFLDVFARRATEMSSEITWQMGRPIRDTPGEIRGAIERARHMIDVAADALCDIRPPAKPGYTRFIRREPIGVVLTIAPWNYPFLTAVNSVIPALMAGNAIVLKHSPQTPLAAERLTQCLQEAGLPRGLCTALHLTNEHTSRLIRDSRIAHVIFTGSTATARAIQHAAAARFIGVMLELGGNDAAYVRADADIERTVDELADGAFFNAGQSCCGVGRIYAQRAVYDRFLEALLERTRRYVLGNPLDTQTTLGPLVSTAAADSIRLAIQQACAEGAHALIDEREFEYSRPGTAYLAPQVLTGVTHGMGIVQEETFGPLVCVMPVDDDAEALARINDSRYGLTASIWTQDDEAARTLGAELQVGTVYQNRCDALDPALTWCGWKDSGRGASLSTIGYEQLTQPKSFNLRHAL